jgi:hypothetical protein
MVRRPAAYLHIPNRGYGSMIHRKSHPTITSWPRFEPTHRGSFFALCGLPNLRSVIEPERRRALDFLGHDALKAQLAGMREDGRAVAL